MYWNHSQSSQWQLSTVLNTHESVLLTNHFCKSCERGRVQICAKRRAIERSATN